MLSTNELRDLKRLKFKYGEYLIGDYKDQDQLIDYLETCFNTKNITNDREAILSLDRFGFIRQELFSSLENQVLKIPKNQLDIAYFILEKNYNNQAYFEDGHDLIYIAFARDLDIFLTNSDLIKIELILSQGLREDDIKSDSRRLLNFLRAMDEKDSIDLISSINPKFLSPDDKKKMLENYILERLGEL